MSEDHHSLNFVQENLKKATKGQHYNNQACREQRQHYNNQACREQGQHYNNQACREQERKQKFCWLQNKDTDGLN